MNSELFKEIIRNFQLEPLPKYTKRTLDVHEIENIFPVNQTIKKQSVS